MKAIKDITIMLLIILVSVSSLVWVDAVTKKAREENAHKEEQKAKLFVFPNAKSFKEISVNGKTFTVVLGENNKVIGVIVPAESHKGYGGTIRLLVGVDLEGNIVKVKVVEHHETPGLGSKAAADDSPFLKQFIGKNLNNTKFKVKKDGGDIDAVTSATISSRAITEAVKEALEAYAKDKMEILSSVR